MRFRRLLRLAVVLGIASTADPVRAVKVPTYDEMVHKSSTTGMIPKAVMWGYFLKNHVTNTCFRACWQTWLPHVDLGIPGYYEVYADVYVDPDNVLNQPSSVLCERLILARAFQRCYISQCAGLNARIPVSVNVNNSSDENKLWAWASGYVARYGPGPSSFENCKFSNALAANLQTNNPRQEQGDWKPFPVGLTAACIKAPDEVFAENVTNAQLKHIMSLTSADNRMRIPQGLRKLLIPIWTSPKLIDLWGRMLPQFANQGLPHIVENKNESAEAEFEGPRQLTDIREKIIPIYVAACLAYIHWLYTMSQLRRPYIEVTQVVANYLLPVFPIVQLLHNLIDVISHVLSGGQYDYSYLLAAALGTVASDDQAPPHSPSSARLLSLKLDELNKSQREPRNFAWWLRFLGIAVNVVPLLMTVVQYFSRLTYNFHDRRHCSTTGFDHRLGWIALSSLVPIVATTGLYIQDKKWTLNHLPHGHPLEDDLKPRVALQIFAASILLEFLIRLTGRVTLIQVIFGRWLEDWTQYILTATSLTVAILSSTWQPVSLRHSREMRRLRKVLPWMALGISLAYAFLTFLLQLFMDMEEYADLTLGFVLPWNLRWEAPSPTWTKWWSQ